MHIHILLNICIKSWARFRRCCVWLWFGNGQFYPYSSRLLDWHWCNYVIAPVPANQLRRMRTLLPEPEAGASGKDKQDTVGCNYLSLPELPASGTKVLKYGWTNHINPIGSQQQNKAQQNREYVSWKHDDVIKWKHFPRNWPFVREIFTGSRWIHRTKASDAELWCFLWSESQ